jgi:drug/metabolite transporter (DMT)-like permease
MSPPLPHLGEILALSCALIWAMSVIFFKKSGEHVHPLALNLFKDVLGVALLVPTIWIAGQVWQPGTTKSDVALLLLSGALGIGIADTLFFMALNRLGAGLSAIVDCLYSPAVIALSVVWLGETLRAWQLLGVVMILSAVIIATFEKPQHGISRQQMRWGLFCGCLGIVLIAIAIVIAKPVLARVPLLWATEIRLLGGILVLAVVFLTRRDRMAILNTIRTSHHRGYTLMGSLLGAYLSMIMWLGGMKYTQASTAAALNQTSNIFIFLMAAVFLKERINLKRAIGITLGVGGAYLVMFG